MNYKNILAAGALLMTGCYGFTFHYPRRDIKISGTVTEKDWVDKDTKDCGHLVVDFTKNSTDYRAEFLSYATTCAEKEKIYADIKTGDDICLKFTEGQHIYVPKLNRTRIFGVEFAKKCGK